MFEPNFDKLVYWITEREKMRIAKEQGRTFPWSANTVMTNTYFCNVHREDDKVTKYIRNRYGMEVEKALPEFNMLVARLVNKPSSLGAMGWPFKHWLFSARHSFTEVMSKKGTWGSAYIVSTNGRAMPKHEYISGLLSAALPALEAVGACTLLASAHTVLQGIQGIGSFISGQIIADLKNTPGHPLAKAEDWWTWCAHGPGSLRGMAWLIYPGQALKCRPGEFYPQMVKLKTELNSALGKSSVSGLHMQDIQNCLCEFDKYMRVSTGTGRSKRKYPQGGK